MRVPYTQVRAALYRPILPLHVWGPAGAWPVDGLLDTGADAILLPLYWAQKVGLDEAQLPPSPSLQTATGQTISCKRATLTLELRRGGIRLCWKAEVAVALSVIRRPHWGFKGFLEHFRADFDGPNRVVTLTAGSGLPAVTVP